MDEELARLAEVLRLPQDVLRLTDGSRTRQSHEQADPTGLSGAGVCLMCRIGLERGTLFGPFRASLRSVGSSENNNKRKKSISRNDAASPEQSISAELSCDIEVRHNDLKFRHFVAIVQYCKIIPNNGTYIYIYTSI